MRDYSFYLDKAKVFQGFKGSVSSQIRKGGELQTA